MIRVALKTIGVLAIPLLASLGMPTLIAVLAVVLVAAAMLCWVLSSRDRSARLAQLITAARGSFRPEAEPALAIPAQIQKRCRRRNAR